MCIKNKVVLWGNDNYNTLGVLRMLSRKEIDVFVLLNRKKKHCVSKSRFLKNFYIAFTLEEGIHFLLTNFKEEVHKPILISTSDLIAEIIDDNKTELSAFYYISSSSKNTSLKRILDKNLMTQMAQNFGLVVPKSYKVTKSNYLLNIQYPCIIKPNKNRLGHSKEFKSKVCNSKIELVKIMSSVKVDSEFILQQYIHKEYEILLYGCKLKNGDVFFPGCFLKDRWLYGGDATHGKIIRTIPSIINKYAIKNFLDAIGYNGLFSVEFGVENGIAYFYEFNLRNDGTSHYFAPAGVNLPYLYILDIANQNYNVDDFLVKKEIEFIDEIGDKTNIDGVKLNKKQWKKNYKNSTSFKIYDADDKMPFYWEYFYNCIFTNVFAKFLRTILHKLRNRKK